jgi:LysR family glycine cleavage system transcriptional activator
LTALQHDDGKHRLPSLSALRAFESAARHSSFKDAAEELNVTQSAVSHQVRALELALGIALFVRKVRGVQLTPQGESYFLAVTDAFSRLHDATRLIIEPGQRDILTVQVYSTFTIRWLIPRLPGFQQAHPDLQVRLNTAQTDVDFRLSDVDACIMIGQPNRDELHYDHLFDCQLFPLCSPAYLRQHGPIHSPRDFSGKTLLQVYPSRQDWFVWLHAHDMHDIDPEDGPSFDSYDLALSAALQGLGIALGQQPYVHRDLQSGMLTEIFPGRRVANPNHWYLACRRAHRDESKIEVFRHWLLDEVRDDPATA